MPRKKEIESMDSQISKLNKEIEKWRKKEAKTRGKWVQAYGRYLEAGEYLDEFLEQIKKSGKIPKRIASQKFKRMQAIRESWPDLSRQLTIERDQARKKIENLREQKSELKGSVKALRAQAEAMWEADDAKILRTKELIEAQFQAMNNLRKYFKITYYDDLINPDGSLRSQITITHSSGLSRVTAYGIPIPAIRADYAEKALDNISRFTDRFIRADRDEDDKFMLDLTNQLLIQKISFKQGRALGLFLRLDIDENNYPELKQAQALLKASLQMEKIKFQVRLQERNSLTEAFKTVKKTPY